MYTQIYYRMTAWKLSQETFNMLTVLAHGPMTKTRSSADVEGPCNMPKIQSIALEKAGNKGMTFKDTEGH